MVDAAAAAETKTPVTAAAADSYDVASIIAYWVDCCIYCFVFYVASNSNDVYCCVIIMCLPVSLRSRRLPLSLIVICFVVLTTFHWMITVVLGNKQMMMMLLLGVEMMEVKRGRRDRVD